MNKLYLYGTMFVSIEEWVHSDRLSMRYVPIYVYTVAYIFSMNSFQIWQTLLHEHIYVIL